MTREEILNKLATILDAQLACGEDAVTEEATFENLGADSLDNVEIIMAIEEEFGINIDDDMVEQVTTVSQAIDYISNELA